MSRRRGELPELPFRQLGDPLYSQRNPHQIFLLVLSLASAMQLVRGTAGSPALEDALSDHAVTLWGVGLLVGSLIALIGMMWPRTWTGLVVERAGLAAVAAAAGVYAWIVWRAVPAAGFTIAVHSAYAFACAWRVRQITKRLQWVRAQVDAVNYATEEGS